MDIRSQSKVCIIGDETQRLSNVTHWIDEEEEEEEEDTFFIVDEKTVNTSRRLL